MVVARAHMGRAYTMPPQLFDESPGILLTYRYLGPITEMILWVWNEVCESVILPRIAGNSYTRASLGNICRVVKGGGSGQNSDSSTY